MAAILRRRLRQKERPPQRSRVRGRPHPHAVTIGPFEDRERVVRLETHEVHISGLIRGERQTESLLLQPIQKDSRVQHSRAVLRRGRREISELELLDHLGPNFVHPLAPSPSLEIHDSVCVATYFAGLY